MGVSTDGGQTWQAVADYGNCRAMSFLDAQSGWIATADRLSRTQDGGKTWEDVPLPEDVSEIAAISLRTEEEGYLLDDAGVLHVTRNGGETWTAHPVGFDLQAKTIPSRPTASAALRFTDADHGVIAVHLTGGLQGGVVVARTADGGQTWEQTTVFETELPLITLYLSRDGSTLTITDELDASITVLQYAE